MYAVFVNTTSPGQPQPDVMCDNTTNLSPTVITTTVTMKGSPYSGTKVPTSKNPSDYDHPNAVLVAMTTGIVITCTGCYCSQSHDSPDNHETMKKRAKRARQLNVTKSSVFKSLK